MSRRSFDICSSLARPSEKVWRHERRIRATATGCTVADHVSWVPRFPGAGFLLTWLVPALFRHRHRRLRRLFGGASDPC